MFVHLLQFSPVSMALHQCYIYECGGLHTSWWNKHISRLCPEQEIFRVPAVQTCQEKKILPTNGSERGGVYLLEHALMYERMQAGEAAIKNLCLV